MGYEWEFGLVFKYWDVLFDGFLGTLRVGIVSLILGAIGGLILALMRMSRYRLLSWPAIVLIEFFRTTPLLIQLFWIYFALPVVIGITFGAYAACIITLSVNSAAFFAEIFRAGINSMEHSQWEGGKALGMSQSTLMRRIILPQAVRRMVPPFLERSFELMKGTTNVSAIAYADLLYRALELSARLYRPIEILTLVALVFFVMLTLTSMLVRYMENRLDAARL
ncbi:MAG: amino acid ABC transporter permease [Alphaproteobacteria bacterium]